jgi:hypothetical protein
MCFGHLEYFVAILYSLGTFGIFVAIWYNFTKIWQPWSALNRQKKAAKNFGENRPQLQKICLCFFRNVAFL